VELSFKRSKKGSRFEESEVVTLISGIIDPKRLNTLDRVTVVCLSIIVRRLF